MFVYSDYQAKLYRFLTRCSFPQKFFFQVVLGSSLSVGVLVVFLGEVDFLGDRSKFSRDGSLRSFLPLGLVIKNMVNKYY